MTNNRKRLEELRQEAKTIAEQIEQLEEQINNTIPTSGLLGRWATNSYGKQVLITADSPCGDWIETTYVTADGSSCESVEWIDDLTFPEQTTRPEDVPVGEAWLVDAQDRVRTEKDVVALKTKDDLWTSSGFLEWTDDEVELITPLIPARPHDTLETVTTEEEYEALPEGSVVAKPGENPLTHTPYVGVQAGDTTNDMALAGTTRHVLRRGWGE